jgi:hypothetical protein
VLLSPNVSGYVSAEPRFSDGRFHARLWTQRPAERVMPGVPLRLGDEFTLYFSTAPDQMRVEYRIEADGADPITGALLFECDWKERTARLSSS